MKSNLTCSRFLWKRRNRISRASHKSPRLSQTLLVPHGFHWSSNTHEPPMKERARLETLCLFFFLSVLSWLVCRVWSCQFVTCSHKMCLNLKSGNLWYLHVSNLQVLLVILILKSCFYSKECGCDAFFEGRVCGKSHFEKISFEVFTVHWVVFP